MIFNQILFKALIKQNKWKVTDVAVRTGIKYRRLHAITNNHAEPSISEVDAICELFNLGYHSLWWDKNEFRHATIEDLLRERDH